MHTSHCIRRVFWGFLTVTLNRIRKRTDNCLKRRAQPCHPVGNCGLATTRVCTHMHVYTGVHRCAHMHMCTQTCMHTHAHTCTHVHVHARTHTHTHCMLPPLPTPSPYFVLSSRWVGMSHMAFCTPHQNAEQCAHLPPTFLHKVWKRKGSLSASLSQFPCLKIGRGSQAHC